MSVRGKLRQFLGAAIMSFPKFLLGSGAVWPSYTILLLRSLASPLARPLSLSEQALLGSLPGVSGLLVSPFGGVMVDRCGRKLAGVITLSAIVVSWLIIAFTDQVSLVLLARFLFGLSGGTLMQVAWSFTAEVSEDSVRGFMSSLPAVMFAAGALVSVTLGWVARYHTIVYINLALALLDILCMLLIPESPVYLSLLGKEKESLKSLAFYRAAAVTDNSVLDEFTKMKENQAAKQLEMCESTSTHDADAEKENLRTESTTQKKLTGWSYFRISVAARRSFVVVMIATNLSILTGVIAIQIYGGALFLAAAPSLSSDLCAVLLACVLLLGSVSGASVADLCGRRVLLMSAALVNGLCMCGLGSLEQLSWGPEWLVPALILLFCLAFNFGGGSIPYLLIAECFVPEVKGFTQSLGMVILNLTNTVLLLVFVPAAELAGLPAVFYAFGFFAVATAVFTYFFLPETKGLSPYEIEKLFESKNKNDGK